MKSVLIVSSLDDVHSFSVSKHLERLGFEPIIFDSASFPRDWTIKTYLDGKNANCQLSRIDGASCIDLRDLTGVWWRRPSRPELGTLVPHPSYQAFTTAECEQALTGSLVANVRHFINPIQSSRMAARKIGQLTVASKLGLRIPRTLITSDAREAELFYEQVNHNCIYKTFTGCDFGFYETRLLNAEDLDDLWRLRTCPTIFQEHIEGEYDLRITIVGRELFAAKILYKEGRHPVDGRVDRVPVENTDVPKELENKLLQMVNDFGLLYAAIDMRYSRSGEYTFFEVNPEGQFLWIEIETGMPISNALAKLLVNAGGAPMG